MGKGRQSRLVKSDRPYTVVAMNPAEIRETPEETIARLEERNQQLEERLRTSPALSEGTD